MVKDYYYYNRIIAYNPEAGSSKVRIIQKLMPQMWAQQKYIDEIQHLINCEWTSDAYTQQQTKYIHMYIVQTLLDQFVSTSEHHIQPIQILNNAISRVASMMVEHATLLSLEDGAPTQNGLRNGTKTEQAESIFNEHYKTNDPTTSAKKIKALFKSELDMSAGGATTYFHKFKKLLGK